jgi:hypothetical protein
LVTVGTAFVVHEVVGLAIAESVRLTDRANEYGALNAARDELESAVDDVAEVLISQYVYGEV